jgi:hypothetical protein
MKVDELVVKKEKQLADLMDDEKVELKVEYLVAMMVGKKVVLKAIC